MIDLLLASFTKKRQTEIDLTCRSKEMSQSAKMMSRTLAVEIATKTMTVINPANRGLRMADLLEKHGFRRVAEPELDILSDQTRLINWLRETYRVD
jgi:hypothetical protein